MKRIKHISIVYVTTGPAALPRPFKKFKAATSMSLAALVAAAKAGKAASSSLLAIAFYVVINSA
jgi:hypothetical protein